MLSLWRHCDQGFDVRGRKRGEQRKLLSQTLTDANEEERESNDDPWRTVAFYRHSDSQRYVALGSTPNHRLTRGQRFKCSAKFAR